MSNKKQDWSLKSATELSSVVLQYKNELMHLRFARARNDLKDSSKFRKLRREIAKIYTVINSKKK